MGAGASTGLPAAAPIDAEAVAAEVAACLRDDLPDDAAKLETGVRAETRTVLQHLQYFKEHREKMDKLFATVSPEGDVLRHEAFDAALALLEHGAAIGNVNYQQLPVMPRRGSAARGCGCRTLAQCTGACQVVSGVCVPRNARRGFVGADIHPDQIVSVANDGELRRVRSRARVRLTAAHRDDPDADSDWRSGKPKSKRYVSRSGRAWRVPGPAARLPMKR